LSKAAVKSLDHSIHLLKVSVTYTNKHKVAVISPVLFVSGLHEL